MVGHEESNDKKDENFLSVVTYERIPVKAVNLTLKDMELEVAVIKELQNIEKSLKQFHYKPIGHFHEFFE